jgi:hypothetical protein
MTEGDLVPRLFTELRRSIETSAFLRGGQAFLPADLKRWRLSKGFSRVIRPVARPLGLRFKEQQSNPFPSEYRCGHRQIVDYVFKDAKRPLIYCELETLDRAQLYLFWDPPGLPKRDSTSKLWHYYVTLAKAHQAPGTQPRYFVWLLVLPDHPVDRYSIWDIQDKSLRFFQPKFRLPIAHLIRHNPYRFYDPLIKLAAREFLTSRNKDVWFKVPHRQSWEPHWISPRDLQGQCELVFITITGTHLVLSRGRDLFAPEKERRLTLRWT